MAGPSKAAIKAKGIQKAKNATRILTGDKELDRKLARLAKVGTANRIARAGMVKAMRVGVKSIKSKVPSQFKDAKRAIGSVFDKKGKGATTRAKMGAGVGKGYGAIAKGGKRKGKAKAGVGIGGRNIHWWVLGTRPRSTKKTDRKNRPPHSTGTMPPQIPNIVKDGFNSASSQMMNAIRTEVAAGLAKEAAKK